MKHYITPMDKTQMFMITFSKEKYRKTPVSYKVDKNILKSNLT